jgi:hypothetical protein
MRTAPCVAVVLVCGLAQAARADVEITRFNFDTIVVGGRNLSFVPVPDNSNSPPGPGAFPNSSHDVWGVVDENINDDVLDNSLNDPLDVFGVLPASWDGNAFAAEDLLNPDNPGGTATATWTFDTSGFTDIRVSVRVAAMGNFETINCHTPPCWPDEYVFTARIDNNPQVTIFSAVADESTSQTYTLASGVQVVLDDPLRLNGVMLSNAFQTFTSDDLGSGSVLTLTVVGQGESSEEVFIFDDIVITGIPAPSACYANCDGSTAAPVLNVLDFGCFLNRFAAGDSYANCDGSTAVPTLNVLDFGCFLNRFAAGCS